MTRMSRVPFSVCVCILFVAMSLFLAHSSCSFNAKEVPPPLSFDVLEGGLWENYAAALVCDLPIVLSGLHEKWVVMSQDWEHATFSHLAPTLRPSATCPAGGH